MKTIRSLLTLTITGFAALLTLALAASQSAPRAAAAPATSIPTRNCWPGSFGRIVGPAPALPDDACPTHLNSDCLPTVTNIHARADWVLGELICVLCQT